MSICPECGRNSVIFYGDTWGSFADCTECDYFDDAPTYAEWEREHIKKGNNLTLAEYCKLLGWNISELARQSNIDRHTAAKALNGEPVTSGVARAISQAISEALHNGTIVHPGTLGLNIIS